eukprot:Gb_04112 [translate_table: standard]
MASYMKAIVITVVIVMIMSSSAMSVLGAGECGKTPINTVAQSLSPCLGAASNIRAKVSPGCCSQVTKVLASPACLCAVFLSPIAKQAKINLAVAITIPKRCNITNRPVGRKCGRYALP